MDVLSEEGKKTLVEQKRFRQSRSWTIADQLQLDAKVKAEQAAIRSQKKPDGDKPYLLKMPV